MDKLFTSALENQSSILLILAYLAGLMSVATPCVFPMIPLTLHTIGISKEQTRTQALVTSVVYLGGMVISFAMLGVISGLSGSLFGSLLGHPIVALSLAVILVILALSTFGFFYLSMPAKWYEHLEVIQPQKTRLHLFGYGMIAGLFALPCVGPILGGILTYVATGQNIVLGAAMLCLYAVGFGMPFVILSTFSIRLPRYGFWLLATERIFGVSLLFGAFWILRGAFPVFRIPVSYELCGVMLLLAFCLVVIRSVIDEEKSQARFLFLSMLMLVCSGAFAVNTYLAEQPAGWCLEHPEMSCMPSTCLNKKRTIVDIGAEWCVACKELEQKTLSHPEVSQIIQGDGKIRVDADTNTALIERWGIVGLPTIVVLDQTCQIKIKIQGFQSSEKLLEILK